MHEELSLKEIQREWHGSYKSYAIGFTSSLVLTGAAFLLVLTHVLTGKLLVFALVGLALIQAVLQLIYFLHLGQEASPRWESMVFYFMVTVLLIIALGSLWIMSDLNDRVMSGMHM